MEVTGVVACSMRDDTCRCIFYCVCTVKPCKGRSECICACRVAICINSFPIYHVRQVSVHNTGCMRTVGDSQTVPNFVRNRFRYKRFYNGLYLGITHGDTFIYVLSLSKPSVYYIFCAFREDQYF